MQPESLPPQGENDIAPKLCSTDEDHSDRSPMACCKVEPPEMDCQWTLNQMTNVAKQIPHLELHQDKLLLASSLNLAFACQFNRTPDTPSARETTFRGIFINLFHILTCPFNTIMSWLFRAKKPPRKLPNSFAKSMPKLQLCESNWLNAEDLRMPDLHAPLAKSLHGLCRWSHHQRQFSKHFNIQGTWLCIKYPIFSWCFGFIAPFNSKRNNPPDHQDHPKGCGLNPPQYLSTCGGLQ